MFDTVLLSKAWAAPATRVRWKSVEVGDPVHTDIDVPLVVQRFESLSVRTKSFIRPVKVIIRAMFCPNHVSVIRFLRFACRSARVLVFPSGFVDHDEMWLNVEPICRPELLFTLHVKLGNQDEVRALDRVLASACNLSDLYILSIYPPNVEKLTNLPRLQNVRRLFLEAENFYSREVFLPSVYKAVTGLHNLHHLVIWDRESEPDIAEQKLSFLRFLPNTLTAIKIHFHCDVPYMTSIRPLLESIGRNLTNLAIPRSNCSGISELMEIPQLCPNLVRVDISRNHINSFPAILSLIVALPLLRRIDLGHLPDCHDPVLFLILRSLLIQRGPFRFQFSSCLERPPGHVTVTCPRCDVHTEVDERRTCRFCGREYVDTLNRNEEDMIWM
ncbi:hypothetical protein HDU93_002153 [Gonapodya sp. JEL0774]|nr:hypothetical protein HDU93_002153 [Gonapodya sp. JEL0774]